LSLSTRSWICPVCDEKHDRDTNAAKNIRAVGLTVLACGERVRPMAQVA
ncbi:zinc ribbon domain-containing protein, partial [Pseudomonas monteilii]